MKLIMISKDAKIFDKESPVRERIISYGKLFDELHIIICAKTCDYPFKEKIASNIFVYGPHSDNHFFIFIKSLGLVASLCKKFRNEKDLWVSSQDPFETGLLAWLSSKMYKVSLQIQVHTDFLSEGFYKEKFINRFKVFLAKKIIPSARSIRVVSEKIKSSLLDTLSSKLKTSTIYLLPILVDESKIKNHKVGVSLYEKHKEFEKIVLAVSRLEKEKNLSLALMAFSKLLKKMPKAGLVIAGNGSELNWIKKYIEYLKIGQNVRLEGWSDDIISLLKTSDCLLVTSFYEGYGMSIVEAMVCGTPVVSTDVGVAKEFGANIVKYDPGEIALKLFEVLSEEKRTKNINLISEQEYLQKFKETFSI